MSGRAGIFTYLPGEPFPIEAKEAQDMDDTMRGRVSLVTYLHAEERAIVQANLTLPKSIKAKRRR